MIAQTCGCSKMPVSSTGLYWVLQVALLAAEVSASVVSAMAVLEKG